MLIHYYLKSGVYTVYFVVVIQDGFFNWALRDFRGEPVQKTIIYRLILRTFRGASIFFELVIFREGALGQLKNHPVSIQLISAGN